MKIRFLKDYKGRIMGSECDMANDRAANLIERGIAEAADAPKSKKWRKTKVADDGPTVVVDNGDDE